MWEAARRRLRMPVLVLMGGKDLCIRPVLMEGLEQVGDRTEGLGVSCVSCSWSW